MSTFPIIHDPHLRVKDDGSMQIAPARNWTDEIARVALGLLFYSGAGLLLTIFLPDQLPDLNNLDPSYVTECLVVLLLSFILGVLPLAFALSPLMLTHRLMIDALGRTLEFATSFCGRTVWRRVQGLDSITRVTVRRQSEDFCFNYVVAAHRPAGSMTLASFQEYLEAHYLAARVAARMGLPPP